MSDPQNLWPDDLPDLLADQRSPLEILVEQTGILGDLTGGAVTASVEISHSSTYEILKLILRSLDEFEYVLCTVLSPNTLPYPCTVRFADEDNKALDPDGLVFFLGRALRADATRTVLLSLSVRSKRFRDGLK